MFPIIWNVIAMETATRYVGECRSGPRDAKIALTAEGIYGMLIYILTPLDRGREFFRCLRRHAPFSTGQ